MVNPNPAPGEDSNSPGLAGHQEDDMKSPMTMTIEELQHQDITAARAGTDRDYTQEELIEHLKQWPPDTVVGGALGRTIVISEAALIDMALNPMRVRPEGRYDEAGNLGGACTACFYRARRYGRILTIVQAVARPRPPVETPSVPAEAAARYYPGLLNCSGYALPPDPGTRWTDEQLIALTGPKITTIRRRCPSRVILALDNAPEAHRRARQHVDALRVRGVNTHLGQWVGGKDAGSGADLEVMKPDEDSFVTAVRAYVGSTGRQPNEEVTEQ